jgi:tripartite-type tricarboxylate transporter receptor subunit TctC
MVEGQDYPTKPIRFVGIGPGGSVDFVSRLIAQKIAGPLGQQVIIDNRPGLVAFETVSKAAPDGYTLLVTTNALWILPLMQEVTYDPVKDFSPVGFTNKSPLVVVVHPLLPVKSVKELIALAKARPGELSYASSGAGAASQLGGELFKSMAGVNIVNIPYKGSGLATNDLITGRVPLSFFTATSLLPHIKSGRLRVLAVTSAQPSTQFPEWPTVAASGLPGYEAGSIYGIFAPAKTPETIIRRLNQEIVRVLNTAEVKEKFFSDGSEAAPGSPEQVAAMMKSEIVRMGKVIKDAGIRGD